MAVIGATQLEPVNVLGAYTQGMELGRMNRLARQQEMSQLEAAKRETELRNYLSSADLSSPEVQNQLLRFGPQGAEMAKNLAALGTERAQQAASEASREKSRVEADTLRKREEAGAYERLIQFVTAANPRTYPQLYKQAVRMAGGADKLAEMGITEEFNPELLGSLSQAFVSQADRVNQTLRAREARAAEGRLAVDEMRARLEERRVGLEQERLGIERMKASPDYQEVKLTTKERTVREAAFPKANASFNASINDISTLKRDLEKLKSMPGLDAITGGIEGRLPSVSREATAAQALLDKILAKGQFRSLQQLRDNSPTGGAVGNVSDAEGKALRDSFGALSQTQGDADFREQVNSVIADLDFAERNLKSAFEDTYSYRGVKADSTPAAQAPSGAGAKKTLRGTSYQVIED